MSRCKACDKVLLSSEMYTREIEVEGKIIQEVEDLCTVCKKIIVEGYEDDDDVLESFAKDILKQDWDEYYD